MFLLIATFICAPIVGFLVTVEAYNSAFWVGAGYFLILLWQMEQ